MKKTMLYPNLYAELKRYDVKIDDIGKAIGVTRSNVYTRLYGEKEITLNEAIIICSYIEQRANKPFTIKYLFNISI